MKRYRNPLGFLSSSGSAYLIAIGVVSVLVIMILTFSRTNVARRFSTKFQTAEGKAESLAEAAVDLGLRRLKDEMNDGGDWYQMFRLPALLDNGGSALSTPQGTDLPLDVSPAIFTSDIDISSEMDPLIRATPGTVTVILTGCISSASAFAAKSPSDYHVVGMNKKSTQANGESNHAGFLDNVHATPSGNDSISSRLIPDYNLNFRLPNYPNPGPSTTDLTVEIIPEIKILGVKVPGTPVNMTLKLELKKTVAPPSPDDDIELKISISVLGMDITVVEKTVKVWDEQMAKLFEDPPSGSTNMRCQDFAKTIAGSTPNWPSFNWSSSNIVTAIQAELSNLLGTKSGGVTPPPGSSFNPAQLVEKGGYVRLTAKVIYKPNTTGTVIKKTLMAEREFKVSDVQPVAPEYVFFVANSDLPYENVGLDKLLSSSEYDADKEIKFIGIGAPPGVMATSSIHPLPKGTKQANYGALADVYNGTATDTSHMPGMIRINGTKKMMTIVFAGRLADIRTTEYNALFMNKSGPPSNNPAGDMVDPRFGWDGDPLKEFTTPYIPMLAGPINETGIEAVIDLIKKSAQNLDTPIQLFGDYFMEMPLGWRIEAFLNQKYSSISVNVKPKVNASKAASAISIPSMNINQAKMKEADETEITGVLTHFPDNAFGAWPYKAHTTPTAATNGTWNPGVPENLPANLYSPLQYAKKATHFYADNAAFQADLPSRMSGGVFNCDGVTFIKEGYVELPAMIVKGRGLLVANRYIKVNGNITKDPGSRTVFGLIARNGKIQVGPAANVVEAACYSNYTIENAPGHPFRIEGNLVVNHFQREKFNSVEVFYNGPVCRNSLLSMIRDVGKFDQSRYYVSLGKQWSRFAYEKQ